MHHLLQGIVTLKHHLSFSKKHLSTKDFVYQDKRLSFTAKTTLKESQCIQFSGTLYNHASLKNKLQLDAQPISDTTLIMIAYQRWGISLLKELDGIFSFALFDDKTKSLYLAKDRVSVTPLYYYHDNNSFIFSSSLKEMITFDTFDKQLSKIALSDYFTYGYILQPNTIYENCFKVKSGHFLEFNLESDLLIEKQYWDLGVCYDSPKLSLSEGDFQNTAKELLEESIEKRLINSPSIACSLSGGYDSSTIAALLQKKSAKPIKTFTIGFEDTDINEAPDAKKIAQHIGSDHIEHYFSASDALDIVPKLSEIYAEPFYDNGSVPTTLLASMVKEAGIDTIFAGDGGDEVFATADDVRRFERILSLPQGVRNSAFSMLNILNPSTIPYLKHYNNFPTKYYKFIHILKAANIPEMVKIKMTLFHPAQIDTLLLDKSALSSDLSDKLYFGPYAEGVDKVIGSYFKTFMTDGELVKSTHAFAHQDISIREPYLDYSLIDFMAKVPSDIKIKNNIKKYLLKNIAHELIPKELLDRPKKGFSIPFSRWMKHELKPLLMDTLNKENLKIDAILNPDYVLYIRDNFLSGKEEYKYKLWSILLYQLWYEKNMR